MTSFDEREKEFEARFKYDEDLRFRVTARRNRLLGLWAAARMGLGAEDAEAYAKSVVAAEFEPGGDRHVVDKIVADLEERSVSLTADQVRFQLELCSGEAKKQIIRE